MRIFDDLEAEEDRLDGVLAGLDEQSWLAPSGAPGWRVVDVVLHLAQTEEVVVNGAPPGTATVWDRDAHGTVDNAMDQWVQAERAAPDVVFQRWRDGRRAALTMLREAAPERLFSWANNPLKAPTLATTRLAEHWAHGLDITGPLGIPLPDTDRLRHIAWLAHKSLPYAFSLIGAPAPVVRCELTGPEGDSWQFGPPDAESTITGPAGAFCRVGARRLAPEESGLVTAGPHAAAALRELRNYAA